MYHLGIHSYPWESSGTPFHRHPQPTAEEFVVQVGRLYGSLIGTMITLFEAIAGGIDWYEAHAAPTGL